jgi:hypothetical protein
MAGASFVHFFSQFSENVRMSWRTPNHPPPLRSAANPRCRIDGTARCRLRRSIAARKARLPGIAVRANVMRFVIVCGEANRLAASIAWCRRILRGCASLKPGRGRT